jgi:ElaB/YqjD/DUF883 family membrane-anchored ribosome-binding protein
MSQSQSGFFSPGQLRSFQAFQQQGQQGGLGQFLQGLGRIGQPGQAGPVDPMQSTRTALGTVTQRQGQFQAGGFLEQMAGALGRDITAAEEAGGRQFQRQQAETDAFRQFIEEQTPQFGEMAEQQAGRLEDAAGRLEQTGAERLSKFEEGAQGAIAEARAAVSGFEDRVAQDASLASEAIRRRGQAASQQIAAGINPDGSLMTPAQRFAAQSELMHNTDVQVQQQVGQMMNNFNNVKAQLQSNVASISAAVSGQRVQAQEVANRMDQFGTQVRQFGEQLRSAAQLNASRLAEMVRANPESVISVFAALSSFLGAATLPMASFIPGFEFT